MNYTCGKCGRDFFLESDYFKHYDRCHGKRTWFKI